MLQQQPLLCRFHGIEPSKKSKEKIQRKVRDEMAAKKAAGSEQPAGSFNHLKHAQVSRTTHSVYKNTSHHVMPCCGLLIHDDLLLLRIYNCVCPVLHD